MWALWECFTLATLATSNKANVFWSERHFKGGQYKGSLGLFSKTTKLIFVTKVKKVASLPIFRVNYNK